MQFSGASDHPASDDSDTPECVRCGIPTARGVVHCPGCLLRIGLEYPPNDGDEASDESLGEATARISGRPKCIGHYDLLEEIGRGGMGVIYRARDKLSGHVVALKCLLDYHIDSRETVARFRREASAAAMLQHPNILPVYEVGESADGVPFFTMQLVTGGTLHRSRENAAPKSVRDSVLLMAKVASAVNYAHERGILHRDLKPGNVLLDEAGEPWISDFGLAKWLHEPDGLTRTLLVFGTPGYIAPEQAHGPSAQLGPAADIYSIGAILFESLSGRPPFLGEHALAVLRKAADETAPALRSVAPHLDRELETICGRCLERDPSARYASAAELASDLNRWLEGCRINARPVGQTARAGRWVRRNRVLAASIAVAALCSGFALVRGIHNRTLQRAASAAQLNARSAVVLPVLDLDTARADDVVAASMAKVLTTSMSPLGPLRLSASSHALHAGTAHDEKLREVARVTNSRTVIATTMRTDGGSVRLWCRVIDGASGKVLSTSSSAGDSPEAAMISWTNSAATELYSIISRDDSGSSGNAEVDPGLVNPETHEWITAGRRLMLRYTPRELTQAIALFERAIQNEPASHTAHAYLASAYVGSGHFYSDPEYVRRGAAVARKAVELAPSSADAHRALAGALYEQGDLEEALVHLMETAALRGTEDKLEQLIGMTLDKLGHSERAIAWYRRSLAAASEPAAANVLLGDCWSRLHGDEEAFKAYARAEELQPDLPQIRVGFAHLHLLRGEFEEARRRCHAASSSADLGGIERMAAQIEFFTQNFEESAKLYAQLSERQPGGGGSFFGAVDYESALGRSLQALGRSAEADAILLRCLAAHEQNARDHPSHPEALYRLAAVEATLGLNESALQHLRKAIAAGWLDSRSLKMDPRFDSMRADARFEKLLAELTERALLKRKAVETR